MVENNVFGGTLRSARLAHISGEGQAVKIEDVPTRCCGYRCHCQPQLRIQGEFLGTTVIVYLCAQCGEAEIDRITKSNPVILPE